MIPVRSALFGCIAALTLACHSSSLSGTGGTGDSAIGCQSGEVRCNAGFLREVCAADGTWKETGFVCARSVAVDDETGGYCATKGDGSFRCSGGNVTVSLPPDSYVRVQTSAGGLVGLTEAGRLVAPEIPIAPDLPPAATFRATNMWGNHAICPLLRDHTFGISLDRTRSQDEDGPHPAFELVPGTFSRAFCAFEGFEVGVLTDGSVLSNLATAAPVGHDWTDVAFSLFVFCGLRANGEITCMPSALPCANVSGAACTGSGLPNFSSGPYRSVTATASAACAIDAEGALTCQRYDGVAVLTDPGPYTFAEGGKDVLCAIRVDGSVACFRHGGDSPDANSALAPLLPINLPFGTDW